MFYSRNKKVVEGIQNGIQQNTRNLHNSKFTSKVEQRIHKKGGEFINYSFMLTYRKWVALLNFIPLFIVFVLMTAQLMDLSFPQDVANKVFLYQRFPSYDSTLCYDDDLWWLVLYLGSFHIWYYPCRQVQNWHVVF